MNSIIFIRQIKIKSLGIDALLTYYKTILNKNILHNNNNLSVTTVTRYVYIFTNNVILNVCLVFFNNDDQVNVIKLFTITTLYKIIIITLFDQFCGVAV